VAHPDDGWVRDRVGETVEAALAGAIADFRQALPLTVLALRVRAGDMDAQHRWDDIMNRTRLEVESIAATRGADGWAHLKRRLSVLAEIDARVFGGGAAGLIAADAKKVESAFAGFHAPACLTLAESLRVIGAPWDKIEEVLVTARRSAHNIQDPVFCARTTARVNAMITRWWGPPVDLDARIDAVAEADRLAANPRQPAYSPVHVGDDYPHRPRTTNMIALSDHFLGANTLSALAEVVYQRPEVEFGRLNRNVALGEPLVVGTKVAVPDPGVPALIAARLAAELVARIDLDPVDRRHAAQRLVPVAAHDPTALDTVLSRLLLIDPAASATWHGSLVEVFGEPVLDETVSGDPQATQKFGPA
jgi:hypothetical protein